MSREVSMVTLFMEVTPKVRIHELSENEVILGLESGNHFLSLHLTSKKEVEEIVKRIQRLLGDM
jgi:hypothetical protein